MRVADHHKVLSAIIQLHVISWADILQKRLLFSNHCCVCTPTSLNTPRCSYHDTNWSTISRAHVHVHAVSSPGMMSSISKLPVDQTIHRSFFAISTIGIHASCSLLHSSPNQQVKEYQHPVISIQSLFDDCSYGWLYKTGLALGHGIASAGKVDASHIVGRPQVHHVSLPEHVASSIRYVTGWFAHHHCTGLLEQ